MAQTLKNYYEIIEACIKDLGIIPTEARGDLPGQWNLKRGTANVWVDIWEIEANKQIFFQLLSPIVTIPEKNKEAFFQDLLQINHALYGVAFTIKDNYTYIKMMREAQGLDKIEVTAMLERIGYYADLYDELLREKYLR